MAFKFKKALFILTLVLALGIAHTRLTVASQLFYDDFNNGMATGWTEYAPNGSWQVINGEYVGTANPGSKKVLHYARTGNDSWENYSLRVNLKAIDSVDKIVFVRFNSLGSSYSINLRSSYPGGGNDIVLDKFLNINNLSTKQTLRVSPHSNEPNTWYNLKIEVKNVDTGVQIKVFVDNTLKIDYIDVVNTIPTGGIGLVVWPEGTQTTHFDNVEVTSLDNQANLPVPDLKQHSPPWGTMEYDRASNWSSEPTIERWGCALTSAAMILQYYGHEDVDPQVLNDWLNNQPDGYIRNGLVNWLAVSRYSLENSDSDSKALEFRRSSPDDNKVKNEIDQERPPIIKVPGHFVVAKGNEDSDFTVNDPASEKVLLSEVESEYGDYTQINSYTPTETDLSYIMLVADQNVNINIKNSQGENIGSLWTEDPLLDDIGKEEKSGESLNTYLAPKPEEGNYYVEITGNGFYQLDSYLYDEFGTPRLSENKGYVNQSSPDTFLITISKENQISQTVSREQILSDLEHLYKAGHFKNRGTYLAIKKLIEMSRKFNDRGLVEQSNKLLFLTIRFISLYTPAQISPEAAEIIKNQILLLMTNTTSS